MEVERRRLDFVPRWTVRLLLLRFGDLPNEAAVGHFLYNSIIRLARSSGSLNLPRRREFLEPHGDPFVAAIRFEGNDSHDAIVSLFAEARADSEYVHGVDYDIFTFASSLARVFPDGWLATRKRSPTATRAKPSTSRFLAATTLQFRRVRPPSWP